MNHFCPVLRHKGIGPMSAIYTNNLGDDCIAFANHIQRPFWFFQQNTHYYLLNPLNDPRLITIDAVAKRIFLGLCNLGGLMLTLPHCLFGFSHQRIWELPL